MSGVAPGEALMQITLELATHLRAFVAQPGRRAEVRKMVEGLISKLPAPRNVTDPVQDVRAFGAALVALMDRYSLLEEGSASAARAVDQVKRLESEAAGLRAAIDTAEKRAKGEYERAAQLGERNRVLELQVQRDYVPVTEVKRLKEEFVRVDEARIAAERQVQQYQLGGTSARDRITELEAQVADAMGGVAGLAEELKTKEVELEEARKKGSSTAAEEAKQWFNSQLKALQVENRRVNDLLGEAKKQAEAVKAQAETEAARMKAEIDLLKSELQKAEAESRDMFRRLESDYVSKKLLEEREQSHVWREKELETKLKEAEGKASGAAAPAGGTDLGSAEKDAEIKRLQNKLIEDRVAYDSWVAQLELANSQLKEQIRHLRAKGGASGAEAPKAHSGPGPAPPKE
jgi:hypothetical protein